MITTNKKDFDSVHLYNSLKLIEPVELQKLLNGLNWIIHREIDAIIIGGTAVVIYLPSGRNLTPDIDILVSNIETVIEKLEVDKIKYSQLMDGLGIVVDKFNLDIIDGNEGHIYLNRLILSTSQINRIGGIDFKIIDPNLLFISKMLVAREKDVQDAFLLLNNGGLDRVKFLDYLKYFNEYDDLMLYANMM